MYFSTKTSEPRYVCYIFTMTKTRYMFQTMGFKQASELMLF